MLIGITRVRNESLIFEDTLNHFLEKCDRVIVYDDCSTDNTAEIAKSFDRVTVIHGDEWRKDRVAENGRHRGILLLAARTAGATWCLCFDADERLVGELPDYKEGLADAYRFRLFDGYLSPGFHFPYERGPLEELPRLWGPEYRDIIMLFRADAASFSGGQRGPSINGATQRADVLVKHYGKCLSVEHWEETCRFYANHFPDRFSVKWKARIGKAIHTESDFGRPLYDWDEVAKHGVRL